MQLMLRLKIGFEKQRVLHGKIREDEASGEQI